MGNSGSFLLGNSRKWYRTHLRVARPKCQETGGCIYLIPLVICEGLFPRCESLTFLACPQMAHACSFSQRTHTEIHWSEWRVSSVCWESTHSSPTVIVGFFLSHDSVVLTFLGVSYKLYPLEVIQIFQFHDLLIYISITLILFYPLFDWLYQHFPRKRM